MNIFILQSTTSSGVKEAGLTFVFKRLVTQKLSQTHCSLVNQALSKHFSSKTFLRRFHLEDDITCCHRARMETRHHLLEEYPLLQPTRLRLTDLIDGIASPRVLSHLNDLGLFLQDINNFEWLISERGIGVCPHSYPYILCSSWH